VGFRRVLRVGAPGWAARASGVATVVVGVVVGAPGVAWSHATLVSTDPPTGAVLAGPPERLTLRFSEAVEVGLGGVRIFDGAGRRLDAGRIRHGADASVVVVELPALGRGGYVVAWRVVSADSHPVHGALTFRVGTDGGGGLAELARRLVADEGGDPAVGALFGAVRAVGFGAWAVLVGGVAFVATVWPAGVHDRRARSVLAGAWMVAVGTTLAAIALQGAYAGGLGLGGALRWPVVEATLGTRYGRAALVRLGILVVAAPVVVASARRRRPGRFVVVGASLAAAAALATFGVAGHAGTSRLAALSVATDTAHLAAACVWLGGLALLATGVLSRGGDADAPAVVSRFSPVALGAVAVLAATGLLQGWRQTGALDAVTTTTYGRLLAVKTALVAAMLAAAAVSRAWVRARRGAPEPATAGPGALAARPELGRLRRSVAAEVVAGVAVLAVTALLVNTVPGRLALARPATVEVPVGPVVAEVTLDPARAGPVDVHVYTIDRTGAVADVAEATARLRLPARDLGPIDVPLHRAGPGHFVAESVQIPIPGTWTLEVAVRTSEVDRFRAEAEVRIR
jgi:copper transport protein